MSTRKEYKVKELRNFIKCTLFILISGSLYAADVLEGFDSLGGNKVLLEKIKDDARMESEDRIEIVQKRSTNRISRWEFSPQYVHISKGSTYLNSSSSGFAVRYHINPRWSLGGQYSKFKNSLTPEAEQLIQDALNARIVAPSVEIAAIPELNWPVDVKMATMSFYPIYGKVNMFDKGVVQFDIYAALGLGQMRLRNGSTPAYYTGLGLGVWLSQYLSARLEYGYQVYRAEYFSGTKSMDMNNVAFSLGYLL